MRQFNTEQNDLPNEQWRDLVSFPQTKNIYWISNLGRYKRLYKNGKLFYSFGTTADGYKALSICLNGKVINRVYIHDLVAEAFIRPFNYKTEICHHISGLKDCNEISNLCIVERSKHTQQHKKGKRLSQQHKKKLSESKRGIKRGPMSQQQKRKLSEAHKNNPKCKHTQQFIQNSKKRKDPVTGRFIKNNKYMK